MYAKEKTVTNPRPMYWALLNTVLKTIWSKKKSAIITKAPATAYVVGLLKRNTNNVQIFNDTAAIPLKYVSQRFIMPKLGIPSARTAGKRKRH
jgi:hypothetical protein